MTIMSNTIPLKEKLDFQQYQLVINALSNIGIEIAIPEDVAHGHENEFAGAALGENEQLFKIELPVVAPLFLTDKRGGELVLLTKEAYERFSLKEKEQALGLLPEAGFPIKNLKTIAAEAFQVGQSGATEQSDKAFVQKLITAVQLFDTEAASTLLTDPAVMQNTDPGKLATVAVTLMIRVTAQVGHENIKNKIR